MASLLTIVAILQYRWTKQLSDTGEARIWNHLHPLMMGWHLDLYGEFSAICVALQVGPDSGAHDDWNDYLHRYVDWSHAAMNNDSLENIYANPDVVQAVYIWETHKDAVPRLLRLNADTTKIESSAAPDDLQALLYRLQAKSSTLPIALRAWEFAGSPIEHNPVDNNQLQPSAARRTDKITGWLFDATIPAIVHPILHSDHPSRQLDAAATTRRNPVDWIVVVLNLNTIQKRVLPTLTRRYFSIGGALEYKLALVANGRTPRLLYTTDREFPADNQGQFDSKMNIFGPPPESVEGHFWQTIKNSEYLRLEEWRSFSAPVWFPVIHYTSQEEPWTLLLQHREGPLEAIATSIWRKNLLTSGIVLLLLTIDMGLIIFATQRAQKLAKMQLLFTASIAHELLTPLTAIYGTGRNAMDGLVQAKADVITHGSIIARQASRLIDLVKQSLLFAATESGTNAYRLQPLQVAEIVQYVRRNVEMLIQEKGINIHEDISPGLPNVMGDLPALSHCLQNLIVNAIKYSPKNSRIGISASLHEIKSDGREIQISVKDQGRGISSSDLRRIFEPFYRSPEVVEAQIHGTGLGLTVAKRIVKAMGGRLTVESEVGVGSNFCLHLPVRENRFEVPPNLREALQGQK